MGEDSKIDNLNDVTNTITHTSEMKLDQQTQFLQELDVSHLIAQTSCTAKSLDSDTFKQPDCKKSLSSSLDSFQAPMECKPTKR